jgi:hypothetical protein
MHVLCQRGALVEMCSVGSVQLGFADPGMIAKTHAIKALPKILFPDSQRENSWRLIPEDSRTASSNLNLGKARGPSVSVRGRLLFPTGRISGGGLFITPEGAPPIGQQTGSVFLELVL